MTPATRIVVFGSAGQLGRDLCATLPGQVIPLTRADAELTDHSAVRRVLDQHRPEIVVNCAAYNLVDRAEEETDLAFAVNAYAPRCLAEASREMGFLLVHFSTDYAFGRETGRDRPYVEGDAPGPLSAYGESKLAGEGLVRDLAPEHLVIRTCGLFGRRGIGGKGGNFVETMLKLASQNKPIRVVSDQVLTPSATVDVAAATVQLLEAGARGLRHVTNTGQCSWFEFAQAIFEVRGLKPDLAPVSAVEYGAHARRPGYSVLTSEFADTPKLRHWRDALSAYLRS